MPLLVSRTAAAITVVCLCVSLAVHIVQLTLTLSRYLHDGAAPVQRTLGNLTEVPIVLGPAALTTLKSHRLGLYANGSSLMPPGYGFIYDPIRQEHLFVAHYHQLHCLHALRTLFLKRDNLTEGQRGHVDHCFMYLHQALLCNVDTTLEPATHKQKTADGKVVNAVTGFDVTHRCKDWGQLRTYMEENYAEWASTYEERSGKMGGGRKSPAGLE
ncbi:hypothetical protein OH77DRAFT_1432824 [Trametes cingulata]|nr:hypothetical protein OH77DRAFT_1432824 [Trametes cingulata]